MCIMLAIVYTLYNFIFVTNHWSSKVFLTYHRRGNWDLERTRKKPKQNPSLRQVFKSC